MMSIRRLEPNAGELALLKRLAALHRAGHSWLRPRDLGGLHCPPVGTGHHAHAMDHLCRLRLVERSARELRSVMQYPSYIYRLRESGWARVLALESALPPLPPPSREAEEFIERMRAQPEFLAMLERLAD